MHRVEVSLNTGDPSLPRVRRYTLKGYSDIEAGRHAEAIATCGFRDWDGEAFIYYPAWRVRHVSLIGVKRPGEM